MNGQSQTARQLIHRVRPVATEYGEIVRVTRLERRVTIHRIESNNVEHLRTLINIVVGEGIVESEAVSRHPTRRQTEPIPINIFKSPNERIRVLVEIVPLPLVHRAGDSQVISYGKIDTPFYRSVTVITHRRLELHSAFTGGLLRYQIDRTTRGVSPVQRALRATQNFYAFQINRINTIGDTLTDENAIYVKANRGICGGAIGVTRANTADIETHIAP